MHKHADTQYPIHTLLKHRWSPRAFADRPVNRDTLLRLLEAARWAPSGGNVQPWTFVAATREDPEAFERMVGALNERNQVWARRAPVLVVTVARRQMQPGRDNPWASYDLGGAVAHLTVQASAEGVYVHQMGGFDQDRMRAALEIPEGYDPLTVLAIGYYGELESLPDPLRQRELETRTRKPLTEIVFEGRWNNSLALEA